MILHLFGLGDRGRARKLAKLAGRTIDIMERMLLDLPDRSPDRQLVEHHLARRRKALERYAMLAHGKTDLQEQLAPTLRNYEIWKRSMENEIHKFGGNPQTFVWYLRQIKSDS